MQHSKPSEARLAISVIGSILHKVPSKKQYKDPARKKFADFLDKRSGKDLGTTIFLNRLKMINNLCDSEGIKMEAAEYNGLVKLYSQKKLTVSDCINTEIKVLGANASKYHLATANLLDGTLEFS